MSMAINRPRNLVGTFLYGMQGFFSHLSQYMAVLGWHVWKFPPLLVLLLLLASSKMKQCVARTMNIKWWHTCNGSLALQYMQIPRWPTCTSRLRKTKVMLRRSCVCGLVRILPVPESRCYMHIQDRNWTKVPTGGEETSAIVVPVFVHTSAKILHVQDSVSITAIPSAKKPYDYAEWRNIKWCGIERCPELKSVFGIPKVSRLSEAYYSLGIFWASQLLKACYIFRWNELSYLFRAVRSFPCLTLLHLDYCPRLIHAFPFSLEGGRFQRLEVIEIMWCGDLRVVFPVGNELKPNYDAYTKDFPALKHIHLHELPSLHSICGIRMSAPNLETVKIRGCWSLTRLPDVSNSNKIVECDCEKEWWDRLEWENSSQADHYKPIHSQYYKKIMLKSSVLR